MAAAPAQQPAIIELIQAPRVSVAPFDPSEGTFTQWINIFEENCTTCRMRPEPEVNGVIARAHNAKRAYFLATVGRRAYAELESGCAPDHPNTKTIPELCQILRDVFEPPDTQAAYDLAFSSRNQLQNESVVQYIHALRKLAAKCNFNEFMARAILLRLRSGLREAKLRQKLNADPAITLAAAQTLLINEEASLKHERMLNRQSPFHQANNVSASGSRFQQQPRPPVRFQHQPSQSQPR